MDDLLTKLSEKKKILDSYKPLPPELVKNLEEWFRVELTYTSNAIEGNTLSRQESAMVIEKGLTVEAVNEFAINTRRLSAGFHTKRGQESLY